MSLGAIRGSRAWTREDIGLKRHGAGTDSGRAPSTAPEVRVLDATDPTSGRHYAHQKGRMAGNGRPWYGAGDALGGYGSSLNTRARGAGRTSSADCPGHTEAVPGRID